MDMTSTAQIVMSWELHGQGMSKSQIARRLGKHRETIGIWIKSIETYGLRNFLDRYEQAKKGERKKRQVNPEVKRLVWRIREREYECCGQKIQYFLNLEHGIHLSVPKIYEILAEKYIIRSKWKKNQARGKVPQAAKPREVIQMDTVDFGDLYAFTAIDIYTREADVFMVPGLTADYGYQFLLQSMKRRFEGHVDLLQTDGGPEFKAEFKKNVHLYCDRYRVSRPYRKNEQAYIESFNRTLRKECLGWWKYDVTDLNKCTELVEAFLMRYHYHRPHMSLMMRPPLPIFSGG
jgi:transposase